MRATIAGAVLAAILVAAGACTGTHHIEGEQTAGGGHVISYDFRPSTGEAAVTGPSGVQVCFDFFDADGKLVGTDSITLPGIAHVPPGARAFAARKCAEEEEEEGGQRLASGGGAAALAPLPPSAPGRMAFGGPLAVEAGRPARQYSLVVHDLDPVRARAKEERVAELGPAARVPLGVEVLVWAEARVDLFAGRVELVLANPSPFANVELEVNGVPGFATLDDAGVTYSKGWNVLTFSFPIEDFHFGPLPGTYTNSWSLDYEVEGRTEPIHAAGSIDVVQ